MERIVVARVSRAHGLAGALHLKSETDYPEEVFAPGRSLRVETDRFGLPRSLTVVSAAPHAGGWLVHVEELEDRRMAEEYRGALLYLSREELRDPGEGEYFLHDLVGLEVVDEETGALGRVRQVYEGPAGAILGVSVEGEEKLVPFSRETVEEVDLGGGRIRVRLPAGLLEL